MSDREKFDAWFDKEYPISGDCGRIKYRESSVMELMIAAWQASRRAALEEAAQLIEQSCGKMPYREGYARQCVRQCADAIRSLSQKAGEQDD